MRKGRKIAVLALVGIMAVSESAAVFAAAPTVSVDEAVYINYDYYGSVDEVNIVKTCTMNGNKQVTDYGDYTEVINLTNGAAPVSDGKKISWDLSGYDCDVFYFEGRSKELKGELPWDIDVSYLLNGKPAKGEELGGASGVVSTLIKAEPNKKADEYFQNNMVLAIGMAVDMAKDNYSLEAPGSQLQSVGTKKLVMFLALPGETGDYRVDIGSNSYESMGVFMMMVPATMSSLDRISDYREVKDKVRDSLNAMSDSSDVIFDSLAGMRSSLLEAKEGLQKGREAKSVYDGGKDQLKSDADAAIDSLDMIEASLSQLAGKTGTVRGDYGRSMDELNSLRGTVYEMDDYINDMEDSTKELSKSLKTLRKALDEVPEEAASLAGIQEVLEGAKAQGADISTGDIAAVGLIAQLGQMMVQLSTKTSPALQDTEELMRELSSLSGKTSEVLNEGNALGGHMNGEYRQHVQELLGELESFLATSQVSVAATKKALRSTRSIMDAMEDSLSGAIDKSLSGLIGILDGTVGIADGSEVFRNAKDVMKNAVDDELDELEEDSNILNIDTSLDFTSFTSDKNAAPQSIQFIMRTAEIKKEDSEDPLMDAEPAPEDVSVGERVMAVIRKILPFVK